MFDPIVAPSLLACDFSCLGEEVRRAQSAGGDWLHCDIMDGHFVDNLSFGPAFVAAAARHATVPLDVHLMVERPDRYFPRFLPAAATITVHVEASCDVPATLAAIRASGAGVGLALNPDTPLDRVEPHLPAIDLLLVMTVYPGFGGQPFRTDCLAKIAAAAEARVRCGLRYRIEVDGGINADTAAEARAAGADVLVAGTAVFGAADLAGAIRAIRGRK